MLIIHRNRLYAECLAQVVGGRYASPSSVAEIENGEVVAVSLSIGTQSTLEIATGQRSIVLIPSLETEKEKSAVLSCVEARIPGYLLENSSVDNFRAAVADIEAGKSYCADGVLGSMLKHLGEFSKAFNWQRSVDVILTPRELEILKWIAEDLSNKEIARRIHLSLYTVKNHVHNILEKMQCGNRRHAVVTAINNGWIKSKFE